MYTSTDDESLLPFDLFRGIIKISNCQHIARISCESLAKQLSLKVDVGARISFNPVEITHEIRICVRITVSKIYCVVIVLESDIEG